MISFRSVIAALCLATAALVFAASASRSAFGASAFPQPVVVVYPMTFAGAASSEAGADVSTILAQKLAESGGLLVKPYIPGTQRPSYLAAAISQRADYYVTGFLQTIGNDVSMIAQVVSTQSGSVVYSTTVTIRTFGDAGQQAGALHDAILRHAGRGLASLDAPPAAAPSPSAAPTNGPALNLTRALRRRARSTPTPSPATSATADSDVPASPLAVAATQSPSLPPESSSVLVADAQGGESPDLLADASNALMLALRTTGVRAARLPVAAETVRANAAGLCATNAGTLRLYLPTLVLGHDDGGNAVARLAVTSLDCTGTTAGTRNASGVGSGQSADATAIDRAAAKMAPLMRGL